MIFQISKKSSLSHITTIQGLHTIKNFIFSIKFVCTLICYVMNSQHNRFAKFLKKIFKKSMEIVHFAYEKEPLSIIFTPIFVQKCAL